MSSDENDTSKAKIMNAPLIESTIGDWSTNLDKTITQMLYYNDVKIAGKGLICTWKASLHDDQQYYTNLSPFIQQQQMIEQLNCHSHLQISSEDSELEVARKQLAIAKEQATGAMIYQQSIQQVMDDMHKQLMRPAKYKTSAANSRVKHAERELVQIENRINGVDGSVIQNELWIRSFSYLDESDLFSLGQISQKFLSISSADELWKPICLRRWKKKQNVKRFMKKSPSWETSGRQGSIAEVVSLTKCMSRRDQPPMEVPAFNMRSEGYGVIEPISWKQSYIMAHLDSRRKTISREEILHFKWKEIHGGRPGQMVQFLEDGTYISSIDGECRWVLYEGSMYFGQNMERNGRNWEWSLLVERDRNNWGWIIGKGQETMYRSAS